MREGPEDATAKGARPACWLAEPLLDDYPDMDWQTA